MACNFSFPDLTPAQIAAALHTYGLVPTANLRAEDIANPRPDLLPAVFSVFLANGDDDLDQQLGFDALAALDNPEHHAEAIRVMRLYRKAAAFLESIQFPEFTLRDFILPDPRHAVHVLSALINYLYYREEKINILQSGLNEFPNPDERHERRVELEAKIAEHQKAIADHQLAAQMEEPMVQQLEAEVNPLNQKLKEYNKQQLALRANSNAIHDKKDEIHKKISEADFELMRLTQENSKLLSKIVQSPEKLLRALEDKKVARAELKNCEKVLMQSIKEKKDTLEKYCKAYEKLSKHFSKIQALQQQVTDAKTLEKDIKSRKTKLSDDSVAIMTLDAKIAELERKAHEMEERVKAKGKERDQIIADENQKLAAFRSEVESKLWSLELRERKVEETVAKADKLFSEADSIRMSAAEEQRQIYAKFEEIGHAFNYYDDNVNTFMEQVEEVSKETSKSLERQAVEALDTSPE